MFPARMRDYEVMIIIDTDVDDAGVRLAKRHDALSLRALREQGVTPAQIIETFRHAPA